MSVACSDRYWSICTIALNDNLYLLDCNLWVLWCLRCSLGASCSCYNQIAARLRGRDAWCSVLCSSQRLSGDDLLRKYLGLRWCYARLLLYHEHGWRLHSLVIFRSCRFTSFALRGPFIIISVVVIVCVNPMRASTCSTSSPLLLTFCSLRTSLDVSLRLLLAITIIWLGS